MRGKLIAVISVMILMICPGVEARTYLVSVGVSDYSGFPSPAGNLTLPVKDARSVARLYSKNGSAVCSLMLDSVATRDRILKTVRTLFGRASADDIVILFFSGHGFNGGFCAYDGVVTYDEVREAMSRSASRNKMMFIDACHSGAIRGVKQNQGAVTNAKKANVMLFLSSRNDEVSYESRHLQNGFFTDYLQKGLKGNADADRDRVITARELFEFVHSGVKRLSGDKQHPVMWGNFDDDMPVMKW